ncbi:MAG: tRNA (adenosine(37)-N6)-threonylcarbamoyltransferase complex ATPase subunit type 1 TsaE [Patescibacteria group bacterium]
MKKNTSSEKETELFGLALAKKTHGGAIFALTGDLGAGKTCFARGFARGLGITSAIQSPTFILMKVYPVHARSAKKFCHVDLYRLKHTGDVIDIGLGEHLGKRDTITIIEWADKISAMLAPYPRTEIRFSLAGQHTRTLIITEKSGRE